MHQQPTDADLAAAFEAHADEALALTRQTFPVAVEAWRVADQTSDEAISEARPPWRTGYAGDVPPLHLETAAPGDPA